MLSNQAGKGNQLAVAWFEQLALFLPRRNGEPVFVDLEAGLTAA
jgi:hypothetical protein